MRRIAEQLHPHLSEHGVEGFVRLVDRAHKHLLIRLLVAVDKRFIGLAQLARDWAAIERGLESKSGPEVAQDFMDYLGLEVHADQLPVEFSQSGEPTLLVGLNHEAIIEPFALVSLLNRSDLRFIGMKVFQYLGPRAAEFIYPVLPSKAAVDYRGGARFGLRDRPDLVYQLYLQENLTVEEINRLNEESLQQAASHLSGGGVLVIYPTGGHDIHHRWYQGTGEILSLLPPEVLRSTPIYPALTTGISRRSVYRSARQAAFDRPRVTSANVQLHEPIFMPPRAVGWSPQQLLDYLRGRVFND